MDSVKEYLDKLEINNKYCEATKRSLYSKSCLL